ncbi:MAG: beta/gamma crystallin-related protein [Nostoc sp.]|uniref:beta/gamma crystallin-related protein n=1 Tax=Nostoc sp. TaxID=1180 RepID=UPI002FFD301F
MTTIITTKTTTDLEQFHTESNINNYGVGMNKIDLGANFQELTCEQAAAVKGGAAVELFRDANFTSPLLSVDSDNPNVGPDANDQTTSARINDGSWLLCRDSNYQNCFGPVGPGSYDNLQFSVGLPNDSLTSLKRV